MLERKRATGRVGHGGRCKLRSIVADCCGRRPGDASSCLRVIASACRDCKFGAEKSERGTGTSGGGGRRCVWEFNGERGVRGTFATCWMAA